MSLSLENGMFTYKRRLCYKKYDDNFLVLVVNYEFYFNL